MSLQLFLPLCFKYRRNLFVFSALIRHENTEHGEYNKKQQYMVVILLKNTNNSVSMMSQFKKQAEVICAEKAVWTWLITVFLGMTLPQITICGNTTALAVGFAAAASGPSSIPILLATIMGYLFRDMGGALRYVGALITVIGIRWSASGFPSVIKSRFFTPSITFIATLITGSAVLVTNGNRFADVVAVFSESCLTAGFSVFCRLFFEEIHTHGNGIEKGRVKIGTLALISVFSMTLYTLQWQGISLGRILAVAFILLSVCSAGFRGGVITGSALGLTAFLHDPSQAYLAPLYAFGGLLAGLLAEKPRMVLTAAIILTDVVVFVAVNPKVDLFFIISIYEICAAAVILYVIPTRVYAKIRFLWGKELLQKDSFHSREAVALKMKKAAFTMGEVAGTVDAVSRELAVISAPNMGSMYRLIAEQACKNCKKKMTCWERRFSDIMDSFNHMTPHLREKGAVESTEVIGFLKEECVCLNALCEQVNRRYREFLVRESAFRRLHELRGIINDQFENTAQILLEFSKEFERGQWNDSETAKKINRTLKKKDICCKEVYCRIEEDGHMEVELICLGELTEVETIEVEETVKCLCNRVFVAPSVEKLKKTTRICLSEGQVYRAVIGVAQTRCKGEELCGDAVEVFRDNNGNQFLVLSDGMGSGGRAAVDGALTAGLTAEMLKAGFGYESILRIVNTALLTTSHDETLATLDIASINLFTGDLEVLKAGAGLSLLLSRERVSRFEESSLPLGILRELTFARTRDRLVEGDVLVMMSDGISNDGVRWVEELLRSFNLEKGNMQSLSNTIIEAAKKLHANDKGDDMTVITLQLEKAE